MSNEVRQKDGHGPSRNQGVSYSWVLGLAGIIMAIILVVSTHIPTTIWQFIAQHRLFMIGLLVLLAAGFAPVWIKYHNGRVRRRKLDEMHVPHRRPRRSWKFMKVVRAIAATVAAVVIVAILVLPTKIALALGVESRPFHASRYVIVGAIALVIVVGSMIWTKVGPDIEPAFIRWRNSRKTDQSDQ